MDIPVAQASRRQIQNNNPKALSFSSNADGNERNIVKKSHALGFLFNQNSLYILATASSVIAGVNYVLNYYAIW
jgi:hypothetical protein